MATPSYQIQLALSGNTLAALEASGSTLHLFKAVQDTDAAGRPLSWMTIPQLLTSTSITWTEQYQAYIAPLPALASRLPSPAGTSVAVAEGQVATVVQGGFGPVTADGAPGAISIANSSSSPYACGLSVQSNGAFAPICAFPLYGGNTQVITPLLKVALMFSTAAMPPGNVLAPRPKSPTGSGVRTEEASFSHALLVDLQDAPGGSRSVAYDINGGWSWGNETWASMVTDLVSALIQPDDVDGSPASGRRMELR
jgi:hypothetical protein